MIKQWLNKQRGTEASPYYAVCVFEDTVHLE